MTGISLIYVTFGSAEETRRVARTLLQEKLIACANHLAPLVSQYEWKGEFREEAEFPILFKTTAKQVEKAMERIRDLHSFDTPVILSWDAEKADPNYAEWLKGQVQSDQTV